MIMLRSALFNVVFFATTFFYVLAATVVRLVSPPRVMAMAVAWAHTLVFAARIICGIRVEVIGLDRIAPGAALISSRHQSAFDTFVWLTLVPRCCYVLKHELMRIPLFGSLIAAARMIPIDRDAGASAIRRLLRESDRAVREGMQIVIFPEGTRSEPGKPGGMQSGILALATRTGLPIIPVATDSGLCWGRRAFRKRPGTIHIVVGNPIPPTADRPALARALEQAMGALDDRRELDTSQSV
nr:lysophospholipid acyltransferase family protein [uncultured Rhodopila sp.]